MLVQESTIRINDIDMFYRQVGEGIPLLLLHGFFGSSQNWVSYFDDLANDFQLIVPDLRGHGRSTNPSGEFTHRQAAADVYGLLDALDISTFRAVGYSSGGVTLLHMAPQQPRRIEAMSLWAATHYVPEQCRVMQRDTSFEQIENDHPERLRILRNEHAGSDTQIRELVKRFNEMADIYDDMNFTPAYLSTITAHTLIVHGDRDEHFPIDIPIEMYRAIPNSSLLILPDTLHSLFENLLYFSGIATAYPPTSQIPFPSVVREFLLEV